MKALGILLIIAGIYAGVRGMGGVINSTHLHVPGSSFYSSEILEARAAKDSETELALIKEKKIASEHISRVSNLTFGAHFTLIFLGGFNLLVGFFLIQSSSKRVEQD